MRKSHYSRDNILDRDTGEFKGFKRIKGRSLKKLFARFRYKYNKRFPKNWKTSVVYLNLRNPTP